MSKEQLLTPYLDAIASFREKIRVAAMNHDSNQILLLADVLRDEVMPELGNKQLIALGMSLTYLTSRSAFGGYWFRSRCNLCMEARRC